MPTTYAIPNGRTVMDAITYTGNGGTLAVTNQYGFKPDLVWLKQRNTTRDNQLQDSVRGVSNSLQSNTTDAQSNYGLLTSFNSNGFTVFTDGTYAASNQNGGTYVGWQWQAGQGSTSSNTQGSITSTVSVNATAGFSIVSYTGNLTAAGNTNIGHGLGATPSLIISKRTTGGTSEWVVQTPFLGQNKFLILNTNGAVQDMVSAGAGTLALPTTTTFGSTYYTGLNVNNQPCIAYCWAPVAGFSAFGTYTGNGSSDGPFIYTGFRPKLVIYKKSTGLGSWFMFDSTRNPYNSTNLWLQANTNEAEQTDGSIDILSNGFKQRASGGGSNTNGDTFVYMAWAENPFKYATAR